MGNIIYEKDYRQDCPEIPPELAQSYHKTLRRLDRAYRAILKTIDPIQSALYDHLLGLCNSYAHKHFGRVQGCINFQTYEADIRLALPHFECSGPEDALFFDTICQAPYWVFQPHAESGLELILSFRYFVDLCEDKSNITEEIFSQEFDSSSPGDP